MTGIILLKLSISLNFNQLSFLNVTYKLGFPEKIEFWISSWGFSEEVSMGHEMIVCKIFRDSEVI